MKKIVMMIMILFLALALIACGNADPIEDDGSPGESPQPPDNGTAIEDPVENGDTNEEPSEDDRDDHYEDTGTQVVSLYFINNDYMETGDESVDHMVVEEREVDYTQESLELAIIRELIKGPESVDGSTGIPQTVNLLNVEVRDGTAFVDFAREGLHGGSSQEGFTIQQIVSSLGQLDHIQRVQFLIDGEIGDSLMGHITIDEPFEVEDTEN